MNLLILGESDSIGMALTDASQAWGHRIPIELREITGTPPETVHVRFYPWAGTSAAYLEKLLAQGPFDAVVISATKVAFTVFSADNRVRRLFGNRVGDWFKEGVKTFDRQTLWQKPPGARRSVNQAAHRAARRVIGQAPDTSARAVAESYVQAFSRLARLEDARVLVVAAPPLPSPAAKRRPKLTREVEWFRATIRDEARRRHFMHFDGESVLPPPGPERDALFIDDVHKTPALHQLMGRRIAEMLAGAD